MHQLKLSAFVIDGRPDLGMIVYNPVTGADAERIRSLIAAQKAAQCDTKRPDATPTT